MADPETLRFLLDALASENPVAEWNAFKRSQSGSLDLSQAGLENACLRKFDLSYADLSGARLSTADLTGADLCGAILTGADLKCADFTGARLDGANVAEADLRHSRIDPSAVAQMSGVWRALWDDPLLKDEPKSPSRQAVPLTEIECREILEVRVSATRAEIAKAFRQRAALFHPDKVRRLSPRLRELAEVEFRRIQAAYDLLRKRRATASASPPSDPSADSARLSIAHLQALAQANPQDDRVLYDLGLKHFERNELNEAIADYERALAINPRNKSAIHNLRLARLARSLTPAGKISPSTRQ